KEHRVRSAALGASEVKALAKRVVTEARKLGVEQGRTIARLATAALLVDTDILSRPEVKSLFAFSGIDADLKADLLCDQIVDRLTNSTVSQALAEVPPRGDGLTAWASIERFCQGDRQLLAHGRDRVGHVAFGTDRGRVGIGNGRKGQVFCGASGLRGEKPISRGSGIRRLRCR